MSYTIESESDRAKVDSLSEAKVIAAEWQLSRERVVTIEWAEMPGHKFRAILCADENDEQDITFEALWTPPRIAPDLDHDALVHPADVQFLDKDLERARRAAIYAAQWDEITNRTTSYQRTTRGRQKVRVINEAMGRRFESIEAAAEFAGITEESMRRRLRTIGSGWARLKTERTDNRRNMPADNDDIAAGTEIRSSVDGTQGAGVDARMPLPSDAALAI